MTLEDGFTIPWEKGDFLVAGYWIFILCDVTIDYREENKHLLKYHALLGTRDIDITREIALENIGVSCPYISIGPSVGIGAYERYPYIRPATNIEIDNFLKIVKNFRGAVWNPKLMRMDGMDGNDYYSWRSSKR